MEGRESLSMSGPASFYIQRGLMGSSSGWHPSTLVAPPGIRPLANNNPNLPAQSHILGDGTATGMAFCVEPASHQPGGNASTGGQNDAIPGSEPVKKKRGRPRKYGPEGKVASGLSLTSAGSDTGSGVLVPYGLGERVQKRRGRPPGSGKKQQLASCGEWMTSSAGSGFTPHVIIIPPGEDIASKILLFTQLSPRAICIFSATGSVSSATLRRSGSCDGSFTHEGHFEILSLSGSYILIDNDGSRNRGGGIAISLLSSDGRLIGGRVCGAVIANTTVQVMVGSFVYIASETKSQPKPEPEAGAAELDPPANNAQMDLSSMQSSQNASPILTGWPDTRPLDMMSSPIDIDLTRG